MALRSDSQSLASPYKGYSAQVDASGTVWLFYWTGTFGNFLYYVTVTGNGTVLSSAISFGEASQWGGQTSGASVLFNVYPIMNADFTTYPNGVGDTTVKAKSTSTYTDSLSANDKWPLHCRRRKDALNTLDGYAYAIPMFKVYRPASANITLSDVTDLRLYVDKFSTTRSDPTQPLVVEVRTSDPTLVAAIPGQIWYRSDLT